MEFRPFIYSAMQEQIPVSITPMTDADAQKTTSAWQTSWDSDYLSEPRLEKYAAKLDEELVALGIKLSIDNGFAGDVILEAKTTALAKHYEKDFGAILLPTFQSFAPRYLIADDAAKQIFLIYLSE